MGVITKINYGEKRIEVTCPSFLYDKHKPAINQLKGACKGQKTEREIDEIVRKLKKRERVEVEIIKRQ